MIADPKTYLADEVRLLNKVWPDNATFSLVFHGHSQPSGYTAAHVVRTFDAYPHQVHRLLAGRFPTAVINAITTAIGGENALRGAERFAADVLCHKPNIIVIDYGGNDRFQPKDAVDAAWRSMIEAALEAGKKVILVTPQIDCGGGYYAPERLQSDAAALRAMISALAGEYGVALADAYAAFLRALSAGQSVHDFLISVNHLSAAGHAVVAAQIAAWFPYIHPDFAG